MRTELSFLAASALINALALHFVGHSAVHHEKTASAMKAKLSKKEPSAPILFEYVEAPKTPPQKPVSPPARISERDAVNRGSKADPAALPQSLPQVKAPGPSNQLSQKKGEGAPALTPSPEVSPQEARPALPATPALSEATEDGASPVEDNIPYKAQEARQARPAQPGQPASHPGEGQDRISTAEMSKLRSGGAMLEGITSFEATGSGMGVYMKNLKEKIWLSWFPYLAMHYPRDFKTADAVLRLKLNARGEVKIVEVLESSGSPLFAAFCMESVQRAGSFGPLPQELLALLGKDELEIKFAFHYK